MTVVPLGGPADSELPAERPNARHRAPAPDPHAPIRPDPELVLVLVLDPVRLPCREGRPVLAHDPVTPPSREAYPVLVLVLVHDPAR